MATPANSQAAIVQELYNRIETLPPDKAAIVQELAKRYNVQRVPDAFARSRSDSLARARDLMTDPGAIDVPAHPYGGAPIIHVPVAQDGAAAIAQTPGRGAQTTLEGAGQIANASSARDVAGGASKIIRGGMQMASPAMFAAGVAAPVETGLALAGGEAASRGTEATLKTVGVPDEYAELAGDVAGVAGGAAGSHYVPRVASGVAGALPDRVGLPRAGTPEQRAAVDWALDRGAPLDAAAASLNPLVRGTQELTQTAVGASAQAQRAIQRRNAFYAAQGRDLAERAAPGQAATPETAGRAIADQGIGTIQARNAAADENYLKFREFENDPANTRAVVTGTEPRQVQMQTGTRQVAVPGVVDANGRPAFADQPVYETVTRDMPKTESIPIPVDMQPYQARFRPIQDELRRAVSYGQSQYAPALRAVEDLVNGPKFQQASVAERNLSALKEVARNNTLTGGVRNEAGGLAAASIPELQSAIDDAVKKIAGPDALNALHEGRMNTAGQYAAINLVDQFRAEPVKLYSQLTQARDGGIDLLRQVQRLAPEQTPLLGRAWIDGAIDQATESGGFAHADKLFADWQKLGPETKQILFKNPALISDLDKFFQSAKDSARVENSSGTARVANITAQGAMVFANPAGGGAYIVGSNVLSRLLYNPRFVRAAIRGFSLRGDSAGAGRRGLRDRGGGGG